MNNSATEFKNAIDKAYTTQPNVKLNTTTIGDALKYKSSFTEQFDDDGNEYETFLEKNKKSKKSAKNQFSKDVLKDKDYIDFKKNAEYKDERNDTRSFGTPNAVHNDPFIKKKKYSRVGKKEYKEATGSGSSGAYSGPVFGEEKLKGGLSDKKTLEDIANKHDKKGYYHIDDMVSSLKKELNKGIKVEMEHTKDKQKAKEIAMDHLWEHPNYYSKLKKIETKEATGSGSSGAYSGPVFGGDDEFWERSRAENPKLKESEVEKVETKEATTSGSVGGYESPSMWAKSTSKKDWGPSRKTQIPGGGFVKIKKKCTKFPYCNQGDISNLKISKNESVKEAIENVAKKLGVSKDVIMTILEHEYENIGKRIK